MFGVSLVLGLVVCFLGRKLFRPMLFIAGMVVAVSLIMLLFYTTFLKETTKVWVGWLVLACAIVIGGLFGYLMTRVVKLGAFVLAAWGGFSLSLLIYNAFAYHMNS